MQLRRQLRRFLVELYLHRLQPLRRHGPLRRGRCGGQPGAQPTSRRWGHLLLREAAILRGREVWKTVWHAPRPACTGGFQVGARRSPQRWRATRPPTAVTAATLTSTSLATTPLTAALTSTLTPTALTAATLTAAEVGTALTSTLAAAAIAAAALAATAFAAAFATATVASAVTSSTISSAVSAATVAAATIAAPAISTSSLSSA